MLNEQEFDRDYVEKCYGENLGFIKDEYFRSEIVGEENIPFDESENRPVIFVANHSGMTLSWDNVIFDAMFYDILKSHYKDKEKALDKKLRRLVDPQLIDGMKSLNLYAIPNWWSRLGCVKATIENFDSLCNKSNFLFLSPEGVGGISKGFNKRYKLQPYSSSFVYMAIKHNALVVPISIVNAEYLRPFNYSIPFVNKLVKKYAEMPYLPVGESLIQFLFPATFLNPYPAKIVYKIHEPVTLDGDCDALSRDDLKNKAEEFRVFHQDLLDNAVSDHSHPYDVKGLVKAFARSKNKKMFLPFFWHEMFHKTAELHPDLTRAHKVPFGFGLVSKVAESKGY